MTKNYKISGEVFKFPYTGSFKTNDNEMLSEKFCLKIISFRKANSKRIKKIIVVVGLGGVVLFSNLESADELGATPIYPNAPIMRYYKYNTDLVTTPKIAPVINNRYDKIVSQQMASEEVDTIIYRFLKGDIDAHELNLILQLRGGDGLTDIVGVMAFITFINWLDSLSGVKAFQANPLPHLDPLGWLQGSYHPAKKGSSGNTQSPTSLEITKPSTMPHQEFVGLSKEERRQLPHSNDIKLNHEGHRELNVSYWQSQFKVEDHGEVHELEYTVKNNGGTKTEKTESNTLKFMRSIADMPNRENVKWFDNSTYQGGIERGYPAIHIYDRDNQVIAVFKKDTGHFVTTCKLLDSEHEELMETGDFGGGTGWWSGQAKNLPPQQNVENDVTPVSSFESDVLGITPIDNSQMDNNNNP